MLDGLLAPLSPEQRAAAIDAHPRVLVLAGAGSGKTRVLVARLAQLLLDRGLPAGSIQVFSFTRKACSEIDARLTALFEAGGVIPPPSMARTFHRFAFRLVCEDFGQLGFPRPPELLTDEGALTPAVAFSRFWLERLRKVGSGVDEAAANASALDRFSRLRPGARAVPDPALAGLEESFLVWKIANGFLELRDQIPLALRILSGPAGKRVRSSCAAVLVDEYQDIDLEQQQLLDALVGPRTSLSLFGDDDQAIYRWRGAAPELIRQLHQRADVRVHLLNTNYRCPEPILALAEAVVAGDSERISKSVRAWQSRGRRPQCLTGPQEPLRVVAAVQRLLARGRRRSELAILVRDHADLAEIRRALQLKGLDIARDGEGEGIRLLTFHGAKGLEFPVVLLPFLERGKFPNTRRLGRDRAALRERLEAAREALDRVEARASEQSRISGKAREGAFGARLKASPQSKDSPRLERVSPSLWTRLRQWWQRFLSPPPRPPSSPPTAPALDVDPDLELAAWFPVLDKAWAGLDQEQQAILHEERRLFYVALTRAREELYLFCSSFAQRSDFLRGVPSGVLEWVEDPLDDLGRSGR